MSVELVKRYAAPVPRYTSYPTAPHFTPEVGPDTSGRWLAELPEGTRLSLYAHIPFCERLCWYCGCCTKATQRYEPIAEYLASLHAEMETVSALVPSEHEVTHIHWGGGSPNILAPDDIARLAGLQRRHFRHGDDAEFAVEVDPRGLDDARIAAFVQAGVTRVSIGVQDFDPAVQKAVNRVQSEEVTRRVMEEARESGFRSVNFDLIYGLPKQTLDSFDRTLDKVLLLEPDRIALYSYAHLPKLFKPQRRIAEADLPSPESKLQIMTLAIGRLTRAAYLYIGMDHFARATDELALAQALGRLTRSFQGYSAHPGDLVGLGMSAIGQIGPTYYQNRKDLDAYYAVLDAGQLPVMRGLELTADDLVRRAVIQALTCHFRLSIESIELSHLIDFRKYLAAELADLRRLAEEGLVELAPDWILVTPRGRLLVRAVCMVFDRYLRERQARATYSKVI